VVADYAGVDEAPEIEFLGTEMGHLDGWGDAAGLRRGWEKWWTVVGGTLVSLMVDVNEMRLRMFLMTTY
jgi:hypothetical protein